MPVVYLIVSDSASRPAGEPGSLLALDIDGDGDHDLVTANAASRDLSVIYNAGGMRFSLTNFGMGDAPTSLAAGDLDHDADLDLIVSKASSK